MIIFRKRDPLTPAQLEVERVLTEAMQLPVGQCLLLAEQYHGDGLGGLVVKRHSRHTLVFQRIGSRERSRWADDPEQAREEIAAYLETGRLHEPDQIKGW